VPVTADPSQHPVGADVAQLRKDIAKYRDVSVAVQEGFVATASCAAHPELGGMGVHYVNRKRLGQPLNERAPQILFYSRGRDGEVTLNGAEFFVRDADQALGTDSDRPQLWGQPFDGPMPGHDAGMPVHYDLHVWTHTANPDGVFSPWNRKVDC
jgi:hypothetical protein